MAQELELLVKLKDEASAQLQQLNAEIKTNKEAWQQNFGALESQLKSASFALSAFGGTVLGVLGLSFKAAEDERLAITRLSNDLKNLGINYNEVSQSLEKYLAATQKATSVARTEQMGALSQLLLVTGDYNRSMQLLPIALDLAAAKQIDVTTAAILLGRVAEGNINALNRYGFSMIGVKDAGTALNIIQEKVKGSAEAMNSPFKNLQNSLKDLSEAVGSLISEPVKSLIDRAKDIIDTFKEWSKNNPELAKTLLEVGLAVGLASTALGLSLGAIAAFRIALVALGISGGPIGWILLGITALVAAAFYLAMNWDTVSKDLSNIWEKLKQGWVSFVNWLIDGTNILVNAILWPINRIIDGLNFLREQMNKLPGISLPELAYLGIDIKKLEYMAPLPGGAAGHGGGGYFAPTPPPNIGMFGNYGNTGQTAVINNQITINVDGSVISQQDLMGIIREELLRLQQRNSNTGLQ